MEKKKTCQTCGRACEAEDIKNFGHCIVCEKLLGEAKEDEETI